MDMRSGTLVVHRTALGDTVCGKPGERPFMPLSSRIEMALAAERYRTAREKARVLFGPLAHSLATCKHAVWRAVRYGDFSESWCYSIPAYTGGESFADRPVAVDGELRTPACFGGMGEPWAQLGHCDCGDTSDVLQRIVDVGPDPRAFGYLAPMLAR
jgi:hypothetical protein